MTRHRGFCRYCGCLIAPTQTTCFGHRDLPAADPAYLNPPDPLTTIPRMQAAPPSEDVQAANGTEA